MDYLIDPDELLVIGKCPHYTFCPTFCKIIPMYGAPPHQ